MEAKRNAIRAGAVRLGFSILIASGTALGSEQYVISTVAGTPLTAQSAAATGVGIGSPGYVAVDSQGSVYFSVTTGNSNLIYRLDRAGMLWHVAGQIRSGSWGDGGPATAAAIGYASSPITGGQIAIAIDAHDNLYLADAYNHRVRKISKDGVITTIAGTGAQGTTGDGGPATSAQLKYPSGVAVDAAGNVYIADTNSSRIRKVDADGIISTVAGGNPTSTDPFSDVGDNGPAYNAVLDMPTGLALDAAGNLYIADSFNNRVRKVSASGIITTVVGTGPYGWNVGYHPPYPGDGSPAARVYIRLPASVAVDAAGNVYVPDEASIRRISPEGIISTAAGTSVSGGYSGDGGLALNARLGSPRGLAVGGHGELYIADTANYRLREVSSGGIIRTVGGNGFNAVWDAWMGSFSGDGGPAVAATLSLPSGVAVDAAGALYIADAGNHRVRKVSPNGSIVTVAGSGYASFSGDAGPATRAALNWPAGVAVAPSGEVYVADSANYRVRKIATDGSITTVIGNGSADFPFSIVPHEFLDLRSNLQGEYRPGGLALDGAGKLYITDTYNGVAVDTPTNTVYYTQSQYSRVMVTGNASAVIIGTGLPGYSGDGGSAGLAQFRSPQAVAVDAGGSVYVADCLDNRIRKIDGNGVITTIAGNGTWGYSGDGGPATEAQISCPTGLAVDGDGNVYVAEPYQGVVRKLTPIPRLPLAPGFEAVTFATFSPGDDANPSNYGRYIGGGAVDGNEGAMYGYRFSPSATMALSHVEVFTLRITGGDTVYGYLMTDNGGPGTVIEKLTFGVPAPLPRIGGLVAATSSAHPVLKAGRRYWFVLAPPDLVNDRYFWNFTAKPPFMNIAYRVGESGAWKVYQSSASMFRIYGMDAPVSLAAPVITGVSNAAGGQPGVVAGSWVSIYGANLVGIPYGDWSDAIVDGRLPQALDGVSVIIGGKAAYIAAVTPTQINAQAPDVASGQVPVTVTTAGGVSASYITTAQASAPAFFPWPGNQAVATHADFTWAARNGTFAETTTVPAKPGEIVTLWGTGFGPTNPAVPSGQQPPATAPPTRFPVSVTLGGVSAPVIGAVLSSYAGLYQIAIRIPDSTPDGDHAVIASVNGAASPSNVLLTVRR